MGLTIQERYRQRVSTQDQGPSLLLGLDLDDNRPYRFFLDDWKSHMWLPGASGTGKTSLEELICRQLLRHSPVYVVDPLGALATRLTNWLSYHPELWDKVLVVNPSNAPGGYYAPVNAFRRAGYLPDVAIQATRIAQDVATVAHDDRTVTHRLEKNILDFSHPLITEGLSFLEMQYMAEVGHSPVRQKLAQACEDPAIGRALMTLDFLPPGRQQEVLGSLINRLPVYTRPHAVQCMLGSTTAGLDFEQLVHDGVSVIFNFGPSPALEEDHSYLLCCLAINQLTSVIRSLSERETKTARYLVVDEWQNVLSPAFVHLLDEFRNFNLRCVLGNQRFGQLLRDNPDLLDAALTNCGTKAVFGRLPQSALEILESSMFMGELDLMKVKQEIFSPATVGHEEETVLTHTTASARNDGYNWAAVSGHGVADSMAGAHIESSFGSGIDGGSYGSSESDAMSESSRLRPIIEWILSSRELWRLDELRYLGQVKLYLQEQGQMTFKNLTEPSRRIAVARIRQPRYSPQRQAAMMAHWIDTLPNVYRRDQHILEEVDQRQIALGVPREAKVVFPKKHKKTAAGELEPPQEQQDYEDQGGQPFDTTYAPLGGRKQRPRAPAPR